MLHLSFSLRGAMESLTICISLAKAFQESRRVNQTDPVPLEKGLDVFHTQREARRGLRTIWSRAERTWERAEAASRAVERERRQGRDARGPARTAFVAWCRAEAAFRRAEPAEAGWERAEPALNLFRPDGLLNDRSWAAEQVASALPLLSGPEWSKVRGLLEAPESFTFLDQLHDQLGRLEVPEALRRPGGAVVAAPPAAAGSGPGRGGGLSPSGCPGAGGPLPGDRPELAGVVPGGGVGVESGGARQQRGGGAEQRVADAPVAASGAESGAAGPEAVVLEHAGVR